MNTDIFDSTGRGIYTAAAECDADRVSDVDEAAGRHVGNQQRLNSKFLRFIDELRRRQVCRTVTMYSVALWLICQVVDIIDGPLELPDWTLTLIIVMGLIGFPIALILSWFFDLTRDGLVSESNGESAAPAVAISCARRKFDHVLDSTLVIAAVVIAIQLATGVLSLPAQSVLPVAEKVAVLPFKVAAGQNAGAVSQGLVSELQHEISRSTELTVIAAQKPFLDTSCLRLTGAVSVSQTTVRVTATLIDNETGEVTWSEVFEHPNTGDLNLLSEIAKNIVYHLSRAVAMSAKGDQHRAT